MTAAAANLSSETTSAAGAGAEWRSGWSLVLASAFGFAVAGVHLYSMGLFIEPLEREFGWTRGQITAAMIVPSIFAFFLSPVFGHLVDRWGSRRIGLPGAALYCLAIAALSLAGPAIWTWWALWVLVALSLVLVKPTVWSAAISSRFRIGRGFALAVALCGTGLCSILTPVAANALIAHFGWRGAFIGLGLGWGLLVVPMLLMFFFDARDIGRRSAAPSASPAIALTGFSVKEGLRTRYFARLAVMALLATTMIIGFVVHLVPLLTASGIDRAAAAGVASILGMTSVIGRLGVGYLFDRFSGPRIAMVSLALPAVTAIVLLSFPGVLPAAIIATAVLGLSIGAELDAVIYLATRYFGMRNYGALFGFIAALISLGTGVGPFLGGFLFDLTGSYVAFLFVVIPMAMVSSAAVATLGPYPNHA